MRSLVACLCLLAVPACADAATRDVRALTDAAADVSAGRQVAAPNPAAVDALRARLGPAAAVAVDDDSGALRTVGRLDGFLTAASTADPAAVALGYVRANRAAFGLTAADVDGLVLVKRVVSGDGLQRLFWQQRVDGVPALDGGLRANMTADGRLINIAGSPVSGLQSLQVAPLLTAGEARVAALGGVGAAARPSLAQPRADARSTTTFASGDRVALGVLAGAGNRLAWDTTVTVDSTHRYRVVVDAATGRTLLRRNLVQHATANIHRNYPGATHGGSQEPLVPFEAGWIAPGATTLTGPNVHAFADLVDNDVAGAGEEIAPTTAETWNFSLLTNSNSHSPTPERRPPAPAARPSSARGTRPPRRLPRSRERRTRDRTRPRCSSSSTRSTTGCMPRRSASPPPTAPSRTPTGSWRTRSTAQPRGPDADHIDNANMSTPPDGQPPLMQMYLSHAPGAPWGSQAGQNPFLPANGGDDASLVYHEYTHGSRTGWWSTRWATRRSTRSRPPRWARRGATGTRSTTWPTRPPARSEPCRRRASPIRPPAATSCSPATCPSASPARPGTGRRPSTAPSAQPFPAGATRPGPASPRVATRTAASAGSSASPRCTATARSGPRRSGTCAGRSARTRAASWSPGRWSCRRTIRRSWTCATRSSRRTRPSTAVRPAPRSGRSSPPAGWASSRARSTAPTLPRSRASRCRRPPRRRRARSPARSSTATRARRWSAPASRSPGSTRASPATPAPRRARRAATRCRPCPSAPTRTCSPGRDTSRRSRPRSTSSPEHRPVTSHRGAAGPSRAAAAGWWPSRAATTPRSAAVRAA